MHFIFLPKWFNFNRLNTNPFECQSRWIGSKKRKQKSGSRETIESSYATKHKLVVYYYSIFNNKTNHKRAIYARIMFIFRMDENQVQLSIAFKCEKMATFFEKILDRNGDVCGNWILSEIDVSSLFGKKNHYDVYCVPTTNTSNPQWLRFPCIHINIGNSIKCDFRHMCPLISFLCWTHITYIEVLLSNVVSCCCCFYVFRT